MSTDSTGLSHDIEHGPPEGVMQRDWIVMLQQKHDTTAEEILFQTSSTDPCWFGTETDYKKANWAKQWFDQMIAERADDTIHTRGMHYWIVSFREDIPAPNPKGPGNPRGSKWQIYENTRNCYQTLVNCLNAARALGIIPIEAIRDESTDSYTITNAGVWNTETQTQSTWNTDFYSFPQISKLPTVPHPQATAAFVSHESYEELVESACETIANKVARSVQLPASAFRPYYVEVFSEKALPTEVVDVIESYPVGRYVQGSGHMGYYESAQFLRNVERAGCPGIILYLADWDASGEDMPRSVSSKLEHIRHQRDLDHKVLVEDIALKEEQVIEYDLPQKFDSDGTEPYVELNALEANMELFCNIVREGIEGVMTDEQAVKRYENRERERIEASVYRRLRTECDKHEDELRPLWQGIDGKTEAYNDINERRANAYDRHVRPIVDELRGIDDDGASKEIRDTITSLVGEIELPEASVPDSSPNNPPTDPLYDSSRRYMENSRRINSRRGDEQ